VEALLQDVTRDPGPADSIAAREAALARTRVAPHCIPTGAVRSSARRWHAATRLRTRNAGRASDSGSARETRGGEARELS
jgi:hypothetical protein